MKNELIPELHDVLKITTLKHNFEDFDERFSKYSPNTRSWQGVLQHHCKSGDGGFPAFPTDRETFLLHLADGLSSGFSRHQQSYKGETNHVLHKLWNPKWQGRDFRLREDSEIITLLKFLSTDPTYDDFRNRYKSILESRAEDAHPGMNITSLETHLTLTGKFYRFLKSSNKLTVQDSEIIPSIDGISKLRDSKRMSWHLYLTRCKFKFNQQPVRARDLNILSVLEEVTSTIEKSYHDNILFSTSDENLMFYDENSFLDRANSLAIDQGLWVMVNQGMPRLDEISRFLKRPKGDPKHVYPSLPGSISPPICEICQMSGATKDWPADYYSRFSKDPEIADEGIEHLCDTCFSIRAKPSKLKKLKAWTEFEDTDVLWVKVSLDYESLVPTLQQLYLDYLKVSNPVAKLEDAEIRFSLLSEFYKDYGCFLDKLTDSLLHLFGDDRIEIPLKGFFCIKVSKRADVFTLLQQFNADFDSFFPEFKKSSESPLHLSLAYCRSKFPFFEIRRLMEDQKSSLRISLVGHGAIDTTFKHIDDILMAGTSSYRKGALYKLAEVSRISERLAELKFHDRSERGDYESYEALKRRLLPLGMDFSSLLTFAKLLGG